MTRTWGCFAGSAHGLSGLEAADAERTRVHLEEAHCPLPAALREPSSPASAQLGDVGTHPGPAEPTVTHRWLQPPHHHTGDLVGQRQTPQGQGTEVHAALRGEAAPRWTQDGS